MKKAFSFLLFFLAIAPLSICQQLALPTPFLAPSVAKAPSLSLEKSPLTLFTAIANQEAHLAVWQTLLQELDSKAAKKPDSLAHLRTIFQKTHQRLFQRYLQHSSFTDLLNQGNYDCVSGSAALGMLLERYGYAFDVIETDYHVFIQVYLNGKTLILESTLPVGGMISAPTEVNRYLAAYLSDGSASPRNINEGLAGTRVAISDNTIFRKVTLPELAGLQFYNEAIVAFNEQDYKQALEQLDKALSLYPSERIEGLRDLSIELAYHSYGTDIRN